MVSRRYIEDLREGTLVDETLYLQDIRRGTLTTGREFLTLGLSDRSGTIKATVWEGIEALGPWLAPDCFVRVRGNIVRYRQRLQLDIKSLEPAQAETVDQRDFLPASYRNIEELQGYLEYFLTEVFDPDYSHLLKSFFTDEAFLRRFVQAPGDAASHHAYLGGLIEHTISVATLCQHVVLQHPRLNSDLLITAALLHDVGKVDEFLYEGRVRYSREGRLLGHVLISHRLIEDKIRALEDFPRGKQLELLHAIISHHGELEWGAPKRPQSAEALVLHHVDNLDAKVKGFLEVVEGRGEVSWPELQNLFRRPLDQPLAADRPDR